MLPIPPDASRCTFTTRHGHRCRSQRLAGEGQTLCYTHFSDADSKHYGPQLSSVTTEIIRPRERLDSPRAVNRVLTRILRLLAQGRIASRDASALGYIGQLIVSTLPYLQREAASKASNGSDTSLMSAEVLAGFQSVLKSLQEPASPAVAPANTSITPLEESTPVFAGDVEKEPLS